MRCVARHTALLAAACFGMALPSASVSQGAPAYFPQAWAIFNTVCGELIKNPESAFSSTPEISSLPLFVGNVNSQSVHALARSVSDYPTQNVEYEVLKSSGGFSVLCAVSFGIDESLDTEQSSLQIKTMLEAGGTMTVAGGPIKLHSGSNDHSESLHEVESGVTLVVSNWHPTNDLPIRLLVYENGIGLSVWANLRADQL